MPPRASPRRQPESQVGFLQRLFGAKQQRSRLEPLYAAIVARARDPAWYLEGGVPDTIDGRFDMIAALLALVLIRMEREGDREAPTLLAEIFIDDMEGSVRQIGIGDLMVGKHVGRMVGALGGRIAAFRAAAVTGESFEEAVRRNIFHEAPPSPEALASATARLRAFHEGLQRLPGTALMAGSLPG